MDGLKRARISMVRDEIVRAGNNLEMIIEETSRKKERKLFDRLNAICDQVINVGDDLYELLEE